MISNQNSDIDTKRLKLIPLGVNELKVMSESGKGLDKLLELDNSVTVTDPHLLAAYGEMLKECKNHPDKMCWYTLWLIVLKEKNVAVGSIAFMNMNSLSKEIEIGYGIDSEFQNNHIACEAVTAMCCSAFSCGFNKIIARTEPDNTASKCVLTRCGFKKVDKTDGEIIFILSNDEK